MKKKRILSILLIVMMCLTACSQSHKQEKQTEHTESFFAMDTYLLFTAYGENAEKELLKVKEKIMELEQKWSVTDENSEIYAINHSAGQKVEVSEETNELISFALDMAKDTDGALEPTIYPVLRAWGFTGGENRIPSETEIQQLLQKVGYEKVEMDESGVRLDADMMLDLGAVGKGYAGDVAAGLLRENGITSALLDIGGNIQAVGTKPDGSDWRLGLRDPFSGGTIGVICVSDLAVVTSGNYERYFVGEDGKQYGHIMNPDTGYPVENELASVTIIAREGKLCDALSTSLFVMGLDKATDYWRQKQNFEMILITEDGKIYLTEGVEDRFSLDDNHANMQISVIEK